MSPQPRTIAADPAFRLLWAATFVSTFGTVLLMMALAVSVFQTEKSSAAMAAVYASQWILPVFFTGPISRICRDRPAVDLLWKSQMNSAVVTLCVGFVAGSFALVLGCLLVRGLLEALMKSASMMALRRHVQKDLLEQAISAFDTSRYVAGGLGALAGGILIGRFSLLAISAIDAVTFIVAGVCCALVPSLSPARVPPQKPSPGPATFASAWSELRQGPGSLRALAALTIVVAGFQGFHGAARTALPLVHLKGAGLELGLIQGVSSVAFVCGALVATRWMSGPAGRQVPAGILVAMTLAAMAVPALTHRFPIAVCGYFVFLMFYEVLYIQLNKRVILDCSDAQLPAMAAMRATFGTAGMVSVTLLCGASIDWIGYVPTTACVALLMALAVVATVRKASGGRPEPIAP